MDFLEITVVIAAILAPFQKHRYPVCGPPHSGDIKEYLPIELVVSQGQISQKLKVASLQNGRNVYSRFFFYYQIADEPRLKTLREKYGLDEVVAPAKNEFEGMLLLKNWTSSRFKNNEYQPIGKYFDGLEILDRDRHDIHIYTPGRTYSACNTLSFLYVQVLLSMGFQARAVSVLDKDFDYKKMHCVTEVWSDFFERWILMDAYLNLYFERGGIPLNALQLHNARYGGLENIQAVRETGDDKRKFSLVELLEFYTYFRVEFRNDWMTNHYFRGYPKRSDRASVWWFDKNFPVRHTLSPKTDNPDDLYWPLNHVEILTEPKTISNAAYIDLLLQTTTPNFEQFEITIDDSRKIGQKESIFKWDLHEGQNRLSVVSVNEYSRKGKPSGLVLFKK